MLNISTGTEPFFALSFKRKTENLDGNTYDVEIKALEEYRKVTGDTKTIPDYFITSVEIPWLDRLMVQSVLQQFCDTAISSTVNLKKETTVEDIKKLYFEAWKLKLKGVTIYREGSRDPILYSGTISSPKELKRGEIIKAGEECIGLKRTLTTGCGSLHCEAFFHPTTGELREIYLSKGSTGGCHNFMVGLSRMISLSARGGVKIDNILDQLKSCGVCPSYAVRSATKKDTSKGSCCPVAVGNALKDMYNEIQGILCKCNNVQTPKVIETDNSLEECPNCHEKTLIHEGGCVSCPSCSWTKCS